MTTALTFCTGNANKLREVQQIIGSAFRINSYDIGLPELQGSPDEIAKEKCRAACEKVKGPVIVEDTALCFSALKDLPGPYIKCFLSKLGVADLPKLLAGFEDKSGYALCTFCYMDDPSDPQQPFVFDGRTYGIITEARGDTTFGWDPIFQPEGYRQTYAEMPAEIKNKISHRFKALDKLRTYLVSK